MISFFYQLYYNIINLIGLPLCLLLSFLHNRIPCMYNAWATDNLTLLGMPFLFNITSLTSPNITLELLFSSYYMQKWNFIFTLKPEQPDRFRWPCVLYMYYNIIYSR